MEGSLISRTSSWIRYALQAGPARSPPIVPTCGLAFASCLRCMQHATLGNRLDAASATALYSPVCSF